MSDETSRKVMTEGWSKDEFPTSAKPIFKRVFQLIALVLLLCFLAYYVSDESEVDPKLARREMLRNSLLTDEQQVEEFEPLEMDTGEYLHQEPFQGRIGEVPLTQKLKQGVIKEQQKELERELR